MRKVSLRERAPKGQILITFVLALALIIMGTGLAIDVSRAWQLDTDELSMLSRAKDNALTNLNYIKFSANPADATADMLAKTMSREGYTGRLEVWYYEVPNGTAVAHNGRQVEATDADRYAAVLMQTSDTSPTVLSKMMGIDGIPIRNIQTYTLHSYATVQVWRPSSTLGGYYAYDVKPAGSDGLAKYTLQDKRAIASFEGYPDELKDALADKFGR